MNLLRKDYPSDDAFFEAMVEGELKYAKDQRWSIPYDEQSFAPRTTMIGPGWQCAHLPTTWDSLGEKHRLMNRVALVARVADAKGVMVSADARQVAQEDFVAHFKLPQYPDTEAGHRQAEDDYHRILREHGGEMENLPRHVWTEAVIVALKTPTKIYFRMAPYTRGSYRKIMWLPSDRVRYKDFQMDLVSDWWTIPEDDPHLLRMKGIAVILVEQIKAGGGGVTK